ncbi:MAG: MGMT family protein [Lentimicrobium sp.]|jgi:methylated-DNA-protein-cysteine methyltransferase-like protein|nr:MGMT family protein [Lentimicrobium sp.]
MKKSESDTNPSFFDLVYEVVKQIPYGRVTSYGSIASFLGSKRSSRMVGWAMNASHHLPEQIPAHRVVNRNGMLTGKKHFENPDLMEQLLTNEGAIIENDRIVNFIEMFWQPGLENKEKIKI